MSDFFGKKTKKQKITIQDSAVWSEFRITFRKKKITKETIQDSTLWSKFRITFRNNREMIIKEPAVVFYHKLTRIWAEWGDVMYRTAEISYIEYIGDKSAINDRPAFRYYEGADYDLIDELLAEVNNETD